MASIATLGLSARSNRAEALPFSCDRMKAIVWGCSLANIAASVPVSIADRRDQTEPVVAAAGRSRWCASTKLRAASDSPSILSPRASMAAVRARASFGSSSAHMPAASGPSERIRRAERARPSPAETRASALMPHRSCWSSIRAGCQPRGRDPCGQARRHRWTAAPS